MGFRMDGLPVVCAILPLEGETVTLSGGNRLTGWRRGEGDLWVAQVPGVRGGSWYFRHLFVNGQRAIRARTPNADAEQPCWQLKGAELAKDLSSHKYHFDSEHVVEWGNLTDVECVVFGERAGAAVPASRNRAPARRRSAC